MDNFIWQRNTYQMGDPVSIVIEDDDGYEQNYSGYIILETTTPRNGGTRTNVFIASNEEEMFGSSPKEPHSFNYYYCIGEIVAIQDSNGNTVNMLKRSNLIDLTRNNSLKEIDIGKARVIKSWEPKTGGTRIKQ